MVAMEESASMLCARVMRGINSMARKLTPRSARLRAASSAVSGSPKPITVWPRRICARSSGAGLGIGAGAAHLQNHVGRGEDLFAAGDAHAFGRVLGIGKTGARAGARFQHQFRARLIQNRERAGNHGHAPLSRRTFRYDSDFDSHLTQYPQKLAVSSQLSRIV